MTIGLGATAEEWVHAALNPSSVAIVGASENPEKIGGRPIKYMLAHGFRGRIYPVNPTRPVIQGLTSYPDIASLPEVPDMAIVCVPGASCVDAVEACAAAGVRVGVIISSGFAETGEEGRLAQERMLHAARAKGMRLVGPNTQGLVNFGCGAIASFATLIGEVPPQDGPVAIISQSGAMSVVPYAFLRAEGIGVRHAHATGNECDLTVSDLALAVAEDESVRLIMVYMEAVRKPSVLAEAARIAHARGVPILALKAGVSKRGQAAASSHTGALATEDKVLDAFFRQHGILRVADERSLVSSARLLMRGLQMNGSRLISISNSGACCVMSADAAERHQLDMQPLPASVRQELEAVLPAFASSENPIDLTAALLSNSRLFGQVLPIVAQNDLADAFFISLPMSGKGYDVPQFARDAAEFMTRTGKPTVVASPLESTRALFEQAGVPTFAHDEDAMFALSQLACVSRLRREAARIRRGAAAQRPVAVGQNRNGRFMSEHDSLRCIGEINIPTVPYRLCQNSDELRAALDMLPGPWVIKACSPDIPHKSEYGLVHLSISNRDDALAAFEAISRRVSDMNKSSEGVIVATMQSGRREIVIGGRWDEQFGAVVMIGDGGKYVESMPDLVTLVYPFDSDYAAERMGELRIAALFPGVRGETPWPVRQIANAAVNLGSWIHDQAGRIKSVDINPLIIGPDAFVAADALVEMGHV